MKKIIKKIQGAIFLALFLTLFVFKLEVSAVSSAETLNFRTSIINNKQVAIADGLYNFRFFIFAQESGGSALWSETISSVATRLGGLSVNLGENNPIPSSVFLDNSNLYLQVCLDANGIGADGTALCGGGFEEEFSPRRKITAVPLAFRARNLGPATINSGETAYSIKTFGAEGNILGLDFNGLNRMGLSTAGTLSLQNGTNIFGLSPLNQRIDLTLDTDIFFDATRSIQSNTNGFEFLTGSIQRMFIDNNGNVGIGVVPSTSRFTVSGGTSVFSPATTNYSSIRLSSSVGINPSTPVTGDLWWNGTQLYFYNGSSNINLLTGGGGAPGGLNGEVQFNDGGIFGASSSFFWDNGNSRLGLGTNTPAGTLQVYGGNAYVSTNAGTGGRLALWDGAPTGTSFLRIDNSVNVQTAGNLFPIHISTINNSTGGQTRGILSELSTGSANTPGTMSSFRSVMNLNSSASYGNAAPNELFFTGMSSRINGVDGTLINDTYVSAYDANIDNIADTGFASDMTGTGTLSFYRGIGVNNANINGLYPLHLRMENLVTATATIFYGTNQYLTNAGTVTNDFIGNRSLILSDGAPALVSGNMGGDEIDLFTAGNISGNLFGVSTSISGTAAVAGDIIGYDLSMIYSGSADNLYGVKLDWDNTGSTIATHYGIYLDNVDSGSVANYGIFVGGASGATTNASIWVDSGLTRLGAATAASAGLRITQGIDPSIPVSGDLWWNGTQLYFYDGSSNVDLLASGGGGVPDGNDGEVQFNESGAFGASSSFFWDDANSRLGLGNSGPTEMLHLTNGNILGQGSRMALFDATIAADSVLEINSSTNTPASGNYFPIRNTLVVPLASSLGFVESISNTATNDGTVVSIAGTTNYVTNNNIATTLYGAYNQVINTGSATSGFGTYLTTTPGTLSGNFVGNQITMGAGAAGGFVIGNYVNFAGGLTAGGMMAGMYIDTFSGGTTSNYGIYVGGASGGTTNASIWVDSGLTRLGAATATEAGLRITQGTDPSAPVSGDLWWNGTQLYFYNGSSNINLLAGGGGAPDGNDGEVQFNNSGVFGASSDFFWDDANSRLGLGNSGPTEMLHLTNGNILGQGSRMALFDAAISAESILNVGSLANTPSTGNFYPIYNDITLDGAADMAYVEAISNRITNGGLVDSFAGIANYAVSTNTADAMYGIFNQLTNSGTAGNAYGIYNALGVGTVTTNYVGNLIDLGAGTVTGYTMGTYIRSQAVLTSGDLYAGLYIDPITGGTNANYGIYIGGASGGTTNASIWVNSGLTRLAAATATEAGLRITVGTDPSAPVSGDLWWNGTQLYFYNGSSNINLLAGGGGAPDGNDGEVQFNESGVFGASSSFFWDDANSRLGLGNSGPTEMLHLTNGNILGQGSRMALFDAGVAGDSVLEINSSTNTPASGNYFPIRNTLVVPLASSLGFVESFSNTATNDGTVGFIAGTTNYVTNNNAAGSFYGVYNQVINAGSATSGFGTYLTTTPGTLSGNFVGNQITMGAGAAGGFVIGNYVSFAGGLTAGDMMAGMYIDPVSGGTNTNYGIYVGGVSGAATNSFGMYIGAVTAATSNYGLFLAGAETTEIYITRAGTNGIYFGSGAGEGANDIVTQDGILHVTGAIAMTGACSDSDGGDGTPDGCDIAETFWSNDTLEKGEVVMLTATDNANWKLISRTVNRNSSAIGIISTNPTIVMGNTPFKDSKSYPVGLSGVLPTKVTDQNGLIKRGDFVTVSDTPGHGMKAGSGDLTLGIAMEDQTTSTATINVLVSRNNLPNETQNLDPIEAKINLLQEEIAILRTQLAGIVINPDEFTATEKSQILTLKDLIAVSESTLVISGTLDVNILKANISELGRLTLGGDRSGVITGTIGIDIIEVGVTEFTALNKVFVTFNGKAPMYWVEKLEGKFVIHFEEPLTSDIIGDYIVIE